MGYLIVRDVLFSGLQILEKLIIHAHQIHAHAPDAGNRDAELD